MKHQKVKKTLQTLKLIGFGFDVSEKPYGGELQIFSTDDITALGYTSDEAKGIHFKLSRGNKSVTEPTPVRKHSFLSPDMAERNHRVRIFLEHDDNSTIREG